MKKYQGGWTVNQLLTYAVIFGLIFTLGAKIAPSYMDDSTVNSVFGRLAESNLTKLNKTELKKKIIKSFEMNNLRERAVSDSLKFEKVPKGYRITNNYEVRKTLFANLDVVISFEHELLTDDTANK